MTGLVAMREIRARWILGPAAAVIGLIAMLACRQINFDEGEADAVLTGAWALTLVVGAIVGISLLGDELANGRLSFYFTRPFSPRAIFGGKLAAGVVMALVVQIFVVVLVALGLPAIAWQHSTAASIGGVEIVELVAATCVSVTLGMAAGIATRSSTRWFVLDVACLTIVGIVVAIIVVRVQRIAGTADYDAAHVSILGLAALVAAFGGLVHATARAMSRGRTDRERAHATLSKTLWPIVVPTSGLLVVASLIWL